MALKHKDTLNGIEINENYIKVLKFEGVKNNLSVIIGYQTCKESAPYRTEVFDIPYDLDSENPYKLAYEHIKTLDKFNGAKDC